MRQRNIKHLDEKIAELSKYLLDNPEDLKGRWREKARMKIIIIT